jgi:hypothetical protein
MAEKVTVGKWPGQPFTFGGVARYAFARPGRLFTIAFVFAVLGTAAICLLFTLRWSPVISEAITTLPERGVIKEGAFYWPERSGRLLAANNYLAFEVPDAANPGSSAPVDFAFEFRRDHLALRSLLGRSSIPYPAGWSIEINRPALVPGWGAWRPAIPMLIIFPGALLLMATWCILALPYSFLSFLVGLTFSKDLDWTAAWKLCVAAQWPGGFLLSFVIGLYAFDQVPLLFLATAFTAHFAVSIIYVLFAPIFIGLGSENPFNPKEEAVVSRKNPFRPRAEEAD